MGHHFVPGHDNAAKVKDKAHLLCYYCCCCCWCSGGVAAAGVTRPTYCVMFAAVVVAVLLLFLLLVPCFLLASCCFCCCSCFCFRCSAAVSGHDNATMVDDKAHLLCYVSAVSAVGAMFSACKMLFLLLFLSLLLQMAII